MTWAIIIDCRNKDSEECNSFLSSKKEWAAQVVVFHYSFQFYIYLILISHILQEHSFTTPCEVASSNLRSATVRKTENPGPRSHAICDFSRYYHANSVR